MMRKTQEEWKLKKIKLKLFNRFSIKIELKVEVNLSLS